jgi:AraC-like DNA-binding protein
MAYIRHIPSPPLNAYIDDLYYLAGPAPCQCLKVLPMPSLHLMVNCGPVFQVYRPYEPKPFAQCADSWCVGLWNQYHTVDWPSNVRLFGVHFKPGGAYPFLRLPLSELHGQVVSLEALWGRYAAEVRERLHAAPTVEAGFALFEELLLARLAEAPHRLGMVQFIVEMIDRFHGAVSIRSLPEVIGISQNHLGTQFKRLVGVAPKQLARCYRFGHVLQLINLAQLVDLVTIAQQAGFYDQPHLNRDFVAFTGHSPGEYLRLRRWLQATHPDQARSLGQLPTD